MNPNEFQITRKSARENISIKLNFAIAIIGLAIDVDANNPGFGRKAEITGAFVGFTTRPVAADGPALADIVFPGRLELPDKVGEQCTLEFADAYEAEGVSYLMTSGTGALSNSTAIGTKISFIDGRARAAQANDIARYQVVDNSGLTGSELAVANSNNAFRLAFERIE